MRTLCKNWKPLLARIFNPTLFLTGNSRHWDERKSARKLRSRARSLKFSSIKNVLFLPIRAGRRMPYPAMSYAKRALLLLLVLWRVWQAFQVTSMCFHGTLFTGMSVTLNLKESSPIHRVSCPACAHLYESTDDNRRQKSSYSGDGSVLSPRTPEECCA